MKAQHPAGVLELTQIMILKKITETPWWRFRKRRKLHKEAIEFSKRNGLNYHK